MNRRINTKNSRTARKSITGGKNAIKREKVQAAPAKISKRDLRFSFSLVFLVGLLSFSMMLLLLSLNKSVVAKTKMKSGPMPTVKVNSEIKKMQNRVIEDESLDFTVTIPGQLGEWFYKVGNVMSLTEDSISNQYLQVFAPLPGAKSNNFSQRFKEVLTIRKISGEEWSDIERDCESKEPSICSDAGEKIAQKSDADGDEWVYAFKKPDDCPKSIEAKCALADKITESFQLK